MLKPEQIEHINVISWFNLQFPELSEDLHHFANERKCSIVTGRLLKRMGVKKGVPDFFLAYPQNGKAGLWLELKAGKNRLTPEQKNFLERKKSTGYETCAAWGAQDAIEKISDYLNDYRINKGLKKI